VHAVARRLEHGQRGPRVLRLEVAVEGIDEQHDIRIAALSPAAAKAMGSLKAELKYYHLVPEWITGMGIVVGQA